MKKLSIKEEQQYQYNLLLFVDKICKQEGIQYFLAAGSLLGAIRHNGFIPWDDDVDIWLKRNDYERFLKVFPNYANDLYFLQNRKTDKFFLLPGISRLCINGTNKWPEDYCGKRKFHTGIFMDIFPLDLAYENTKKNIRVQKKLKIIMSILKHKTVPLKFGKSFKNKLLIFVSKIFPAGVLSSYYERTLKKVNKTDSECITYYCSSYKPSKTTYKKAWFDTSSRYSFESGSFPVPVDFKNVLETLYGHDYMNPRKTKPESIPAFSYLD